jgi:hexosaminidase
VCILENSCIFVLSIFIKNYIQMKQRIFSFLAALVLFAACHSNSDIQLVQSIYNEGIHIIPQPAYLEQHDGVFVLNRKIKIVATTENIYPVAAYFAQKMRTSTGFEIPISKKSVSHAIHLMIDSSLDVNDEGYYLEVSKDQVEVKAKTPQGLFYGMQSFMQLLPAEIENPSITTALWEAPAVFIKDEPRFAYRGQHLDPCRHFIPVENVKKQLDVMAMFKINRLHWHLTDDQGWRIEIKKYPKLTQIGGKRIDGEGTEHKGYYTQEQIKEIVDYAADRFITIIPEIELPGHAMAAIAAYPELSCKGDTLSPRIIWGVEDIVMCAGKESTFEMLSDIFKEVVELFPGKYIHIGGDECPKTEWKSCPLCQQRIKEEGLTANLHHTAEQRLQSYFVERMEKVINSYGRQIIGWDEILEGGLAPNATVMSWRGEEGGINAAKLEHDVIMTPNPKGFYIDHYQGDYKIEPVSIGGYSTPEKIYIFDPVPAELKGTPEAKHILGAQCNAWSEYMYNTDIMEYRIYPRMLAAAEVNWTPVERKNYQDFERRLNNAYVRLDAHQINYHIPQPEQPYGSCNFIAFTDSAVLKFTTSRPIDIFYTLDGSTPNANSTKYSKPIVLKKNSELKICSMLPSGKSSQMRSIQVVKQDFSPSVELKHPKKGLQMNIIDGMFLNVNELEKSSIMTMKNKIMNQWTDLTQYVKTTESMRNVQQYAAIANGYIYIPEDGIYYFSSDNEEVWIDGQKIIDNGGEVKRFSRHDHSLALQAGYHPVKVVFLGHIIGGWPSNWNNGAVNIRQAEQEKFEPIAEIYY